MDGYVEYIFPEGSQIPFNTEDGCVLVSHNSAAILNFHEKSARRILI